ncbi:MAG: flagellar motor switch protein FliN [Pirellulales bacterium]|nr:flagellar motor switch protein FliN [Pirellulales bacterium]
MADDAQAPDDAGTQPKANPDELSASDIEDLLKQAEDALATAEDPGTSPAADATSAFELPNLAASTASTEVASLELIHDVELDLRIELGRTHMYLEDVLKLRKGAVVTLDKLAGDPVEIFVNGRLIARGEVLVLNENFCVRVAELVAGDGSKPG